MTLELFRPFEVKFCLFFSGLERLFINDVIVNLYARIYNNGDTVIEPCSQVGQLIFVLKGQLAICENSGDPFCILNEGSYFGDFQILNETPCLFKVKAVEIDDYLT